MHISNHRSRLNTFNTEEGYNIAFVDEGNGPAILLLHGVPTSSYLYRKVINKLRANGRRVIAPDFLGYGNSDKPVGYDLYSSKLQAQRILKLMDHLQINSWIQCCHDMGGMVNWELLRIDSSRVSALMLLNTIIYQEGFCPPLKFNKNWITRFYTRLYCSSGLGSRIIATTLNNGTSENFKLSQEELHNYTQPMKEGSSYALNYFFSLTGSPLPDYSIILKAINVPVKVIWGSRDDILVWEKQSARVMADLNIPKEHVFTISGAKHFIQEEESELIADVLLSF